VGDKILDKETNKEPSAFSELFREPISILKNENLLNARHVPDKIVARDAQKQAIAHNLGSILRHGEPSNMYIWGDTGVGKTITVRYVLNILQDGLKSQAKDILIDTVIIDCTAIRSEIIACTEILTQLTGIQMKSGFQFYYYLNDIWKIIDKKAKEHAYYTLILFFDEINSFDSPDDMIYQFSRALAHQKIQSSNVAIGIIAASNKKDYLDTLRPNVLSSAKFRYIDFPNYNEDELYEILETKKEAFVDGALPDDIVRYCAKNVSERYHGDARHAIDILYEAAKIVIQREGTEITREYLDEAEKVVNDRVTLEMLKRIPLHDRLLILAVYVSNKVMKQNSATMSPHTGIVLLAYRKICEIISQRPNGDTYVSGRIKALDNEQILHAEFVKGRGNTRYMTVANDVEAVIYTLFTKADLQRIEDNYCDLEAVIIAKTKRQAVNQLTLI
jgi:archaeal cell division control protein 6